MRTHRKIINESYILSSTNPIKSAWDVIKCNTRATQIRNTHKEFNFGGTPVTDPLKVADCFNFMFCNANQDHPTYPSFPNSSSPSKTFFLFPTDPFEVSKALNAFSNKWSSGFDEIPIPILKAVKDYISVPLAHIINATFDEGHFPNYLKLAYVNPIYKQGPRADPNNYRPISVLPSLSKIFEKIFLSRLTNFLKSFQLLDQAQHGFLAGKSTTTATFQLLSHIHKALENRNTTLGIFYDLSKAFDSINHKILFSKLSRLGIKGNALLWIKSFLSNRQQQVKYSYQADTGPNITLSKQLQVHIPRFPPRLNTWTPALYNFYK